MKCDLHIHTYFSEDSREIFDEYCRQAIDTGIDCICFTDHVDNNPIDFGCGFYRPDDYFDEIQRAKEKFGDRILILSGMEFSEPHVYQREFEELKKRPYDFIIGSLHYWYEDMFPSVMIRNQVSVETCYEYYWRELLKMVETGGFDALGHMDFPKRYYGNMLFERGQIEEIFSVMLKNGIIPEVNTSSLRKGLDSTMPDAEFMKIYKSVGGGYYTTGSDAHFACDLYADIDNVKAEMEEIGLRDVYFVERGIVGD